MTDVLIASQMFYPDMAATAKVMTDLASDLAESGYSVSVVSQNRAYNDPAIKYSPKESLGNVEIHRFGVPKISKNTVLGRVILSYLVEKRTTQLVKSQQPKIYLSVSNPANMALRIARLARDADKPFVYVLHDLYPDVLVRTGRISEKSLISSKMKMISTELFSLSTRVVVLGRDVADYLAEEYCVSKEKIIVITNWGPEELPRVSCSYGRFRKKHGLEDKFIILYSGNIGETADFDTLIGAAEMIAKQDEQVKLVIVGNGRHRKTLEKKSERISNVLLLDFLSETDYLEMMSEVDCFFVSLKRELYGNSVPSKTYYYMSAGKPIIGVLPENSEAALTIKENRVGIVCSDYDESTLTDAILRLKSSRQLMDEFSSNAVSCFSRLYSRKKVTRKYVNLLQEMIT